MTDYSLHLQTSWQEAGRVILALNKVMATVHSEAGGKGFTNAIDQSHTVSQEVACGGARRTGQDSHQLLHQSLLVLLHIHLSCGQNHA